MKSIVALLVLIAVLLGGYFWYHSSVKAKQAAEARQRIETAQDEIGQCRDEIDRRKEKLAKLPETLAAAEEEHDRLERQIADRRSLQNEKEEAFRKLQAESTRSAVNFRQEQSSRTSGDGMDASALRSAEKRLALLECHFNCMQRSKRPKDHSDRRRTRNGKWYYDSSLRQVMWRCSRHGFTFEKSIEYLDYKREKSALEKEISRWKEAGEQHEAEAKERQEQLAQQKIQWEKRKAEIVEQRKSIQAEIQNLKNELAGLQRDLRESERKISQVKSDEANLQREIENLESQIEEKQQAIENDRKIAG